MRKRLLLGFGLMWQMTSAQDVHFTQFHVNPTIYNPAAAGAFSGNFRAAANYRSQWRSMTNKPFRTYSFNIDGAFNKRKGEKGYLGGGLSIYRDIAGQTSFGSTVIDLSLSGSVYLSKYSTLSGGIQGGWSQKGIATDRLQWDSQYNGTAFDPTLPSGESLNYVNADYFDFSAGVLWSFGTSASTLASFDELSGQVGLAYHHIPTPQNLAIFGSDDQIHARYVLHGELSWATPYSNLYIKPRVNIQVQEPTREYNLGIMTRWLIQDGSKYTGRNPGTALSLGAYYRVADAIAPCVEFEYGGFSVGFSYDITLSSLTRANYALGGMEMFIRFQNPNPFFRFHRGSSGRYP